MWFNRPVGRVLNPEPPARADAFIIPDNSRRKRKSPYFSSVRSVFVLWSADLSSCELWVIPPLWACLVGSPNEADVQ